MATPEGVGPYLDRLLDSTKEGAIDWVSLNPTTYMWSVTMPPAKVNLQQIKKVVPVRAPNGTVVGKAIVAFVLQAFDGDGTLRLTVDGAKDEATNGKLETIFREIQRYLDKQSVNFLDSLLPPRRKE